MKLKQGYNLVSHIIEDNSQLNNENLLVTKGNELFRIFLIIIMVSSIVYSGLSFLNDNTFDGILLSILFPISLGLDWMVRKGHPVIAKTINSIILTGFITTLSVIDGQETYILVFFIPVMLNSLLIFRGPEKRLGVIISIAMFFVLAMLIVYHFYYPQTAIHTKSHLFTEWMFNLLGASILTALELLFILNITEKIQLKLLEQGHSLKSINAQLNASLITRDKITGIISHDVRGPVALTNAILKELNWGDKLNDEERSVLAEIQRRADATVDLIDNLILWSRSQTNQIDFTPKNFSTRDFSEIVKSVGNLLPNKMISLDLHIEDFGVIQADKFLLEVVIRNLISNGVKFTPNGGNLTVIAKPTNEGVYIAFSDSGVGMDQDKIQQVLLGKGTSTTGTNNEMGHGLGLQLVREFIHKHGAELQIKSEKGIGTTFSFTLPIR